MYGCIYCTSGGQRVHDAHGPGLGGVRAAGAVPGGVRRGGRAALAPRRRRQRLRVRAPDAAPGQRAPRQARQPHYGHYAQVPDNVIISQYVQSLWGILKQALISSIDN